MNKTKVTIFVVCLAIAILIITQNKNSSVINTLDTQSNIREFNNHVVFYPQHQDDEVLWAGSAIISAIKQCGPENVYIVLVSDGSGVNVFNNMKFKELTRKEKSELRNNEFYSSLKELGVKKENIIILADIDHKEGTHFDLMKEIALDFENRFDGDVTHIAHSSRYDNHVMHKKNGKVIKELKEEGLINDDLYFIKPKYVEKIPKNEMNTYTVENQDDSGKIKNACREYEIIDEKDKKFGIGYTSSPKYFKDLLKDSKYTSYLSEN